MAVEFVESETVDVDFPVAFFQEATCRAHILHYKVLDVAHEGDIGLWKHAVQFAIAQLHRDKI